MKMIPVGWDVYHSDSLCLFYVRKPLSHAETLSSCSCSCTATWLPLFSLLLSFGLQISLCQALSGSVATSRFEIVISAVQLGWAALCGGGGSRSILAKSREKCRQKCREKFREKCREGREGNLEAEGAQLGPSAAGASHSGSSSDSSRLMRPKWAGIFKTPTLAEKSLLTPEWILRPQN